MADRSPDRFKKALAAIRVFAATSAMALVFSTGPALADVKEGVDAWSAGDFNRAVAEWRGPAQGGDADAIFNLAQAYRLGRGVDADIERAKAMYAEAARKGHIKAADNYGLLLFQQGEQQSAMPMIRAASDRGDPRAQYIMGLAHFNADYAEKDWVRAYALVTLAQSAGLPQAAKALGEMDRYVPSKQREQAQALARQIESEASARRAAELAAIDLGSRPAVAAPVAAPAPAPARVAVAIPAVRKVSRPKPAANSDRARGPWKIQLGAFGVAGNADRLWSRISGYSMLTGTEKLLVRSGKLTRLLAGGFASQVEAKSACAQLKRRGQDCLVIRN